MALQALKPVASEATWFRDEVTGQHVLQLTRGAGHSVHAYYDHPPWCPRTGRVVFSRRLPGTAEGGIFIVDADGANLTRVGESRAMIPNTGAMAQWSPDGRRVYFRDVNGSDQLVRWVDVETGESGSYPGSLRMVRPGGREYAYHTERIYLSESDLGPARRAEYGIFVRDLYDGISRMLASIADCLEIHPHKDRIAGLPLFVKHTKWSPAGDRMMFAFSSGKRPDGPPHVHEIYVVGADGTGLRRVGPMGNHPSWHPDGRRILINDRIDGRLHLTLLDVETGERDFATDRVPGMGHPSYSPDGQWILLDEVPARQGAAALKVVNPGTGSVRELIATRVTDHSHDGTHLHPVWSQNGSQILYASDASGSSQLCVVSFP